MPNIARATPRPMPVRAGVPAPKTKILLVRQPVKSVRKADEPNRDALHLAYGVVIAVGVFATVWLMGYLGFRLGFAPTVRVPDLMAEGAGGLASGVMMLISLPQTILIAGIEQPMALMLGFALIAIPAAILGAVKPVAPGGPRPKPEIVALSIMGAIAAALNAGAVVWWAVSPLRAGFIISLPFTPFSQEPLSALGAFSPQNVDRWLTNMQIAGGMDVLATIAAALWVVVIMRLAIPTWLRALTASACFFALAIIITATSTSNVTIAQLTAQRPLVVGDEGPVDPQLLIGHTPRAAVSARIQHNTVLIDMRNRPVDMSIGGQQSFVDYMKAHAPAPE